MNQKRICGSLMALSFLLCVSGTAVYALPETAVVNQFETGSVDIRIREYSEQDGKRVEGEKIFEHILPGQFLSDIPVIYNEGADCYVRVKPVFEGTELLSQENLEGIASDWKWAKDGYLYYQKPLLRDTKADVFQGIRIPTDFPQGEMEGKNIRLSLHVDSIQAAHFQPDFSKDLPWGQVEIQANQRDEGHQLRSFTDTEQKEFKIDYQGNTQSMVINEDDFFSHFPYLMPGDTYADHIILENNGSGDAQFYFKNEILLLDEILKKVELLIITEIEGQTKVVYQGPLEGEEITDAILLGTIPQSKRATFSFVLSVPKELNNDYTYLKSCVKWIFSTEEIPSSVQTGDVDALALLLTSMGLSLAVATCVLLIKKDHTNKMDERSESEGRR